MQPKFDLRKFSKGRTLATPSIFNEKTIRSEKFDLRRNETDIQFGAKCKNDNNHKNEAPNCRQFRKLNSIFKKIRIYYSKRKFFMDTHQVFCFNSCSTSNFYS